MRKFLATAFLVCLLAGSARADDLDDLPRGHWLAVGTNQLNTVGIRPNPLPPGSVTQGVMAFSGGFYDTARDRLLVFGGGHGDYAGNEIYAFDLATVTWSRIWGPTPNAQITAIDDTPATDCSPFPANTREVYDDCNPSSRHTYSGIIYVPSVDKYFVHGGSLWSGAGGFSNQTWFFDPATDTWELLAAASSCINNFTVPVAVFDPERNKIYVDKSTKLCEYDPVADTWTQRGDDSAGGGHSTDQSQGVWDPVSKRFFLIGGGETRYWQINPGAGNNPLTVATTTGDQTCENTNKIGADYSEAIKRIICKTLSGTDVYALDPATLVWEKLSVAAGNSVTPPSATAFYGRWRYVPSKNIFIGISSVSSAVYALRLNWPFGMRFGGETNRKFSAGMKVGG